MKQIEDRFETFEQEITNIKIGLQRLPELETKMTKHIKRVDVQNELNAQQTQKILSYIKSMMKDSSSETSETERIASKMKTKVTKTQGEQSSNQEENERNPDRNKFKKVEMPVFNGEDPDSWLFRADRYFQIHKLTDSEKMTVATISFGVPALNWSGGRTWRKGS